MEADQTQQAIAQIKQFTESWNELYAAHEFEAMKQLATTDVGIANAGESTSASGLIYGRQAYYEGIYNAYHGDCGDEHNLLVMHYEGWEYIPLGDVNTFFTIGKYSLGTKVVGVNSWLLRRESLNAPWQIFRVINN